MENIVVVYLDILVQNHQNPEAIGDLHQDFFKRVGQGTYMKIGGTISGLAD